MKEEDKSRIRETYAKLKDRHPEINTEDAQKTINFFERCEARNEKEHKSLLEFLLKNDSKSMAQKSAELYELTKNDGTKVELNAYYCDNCGYLTGKTIKRQLDRTGNEFYCRKCGELIGENTNSFR